MVSKNMHKDWSNFTQLHDFVFHANTTHTVSCSTEMI